MSSLDSRKRALAAQRHEHGGGHVPTQAKVLDEDQFKKFTRTIRKAGGEHWQRDLVAVYLAFMAGLRPVEISKLEWARHICDADGQIGEMLILTSDISKKRHGRVIPVCDELRGALRALRALRPDNHYVFYPTNTPESLHDKVSANAVSQFFVRAFRRSGFVGCSAYSGRRTFITEKARQCGGAGCSIRDVQIMAGHSSLATTAKYIQPSPHVAKLVKLPLYAA